jgi:flagellin
MGLRINSRTDALAAVRVLNIVQAQQATALERISSGFRINRAADSPSGLVISELLRSQLGGISQASENTQFASNLVSTADAGLAQISSILTDVRSRVLAVMNDGAMSPAQQEAHQQAVDMSLRAIDRIASTTRWAGMNLLGGDYAFSTGNLPSEVLDVRISGADVSSGLPTDVTIGVISPATRAQATGVIAANQAGDSRIRITGEYGSAEVFFSAGATQTEVEDAINALSDTTGVEAAGGQIRSVNYGSAASVRVEELQGSVSGITAGYYNGEDVRATVNGVAAQGNGNVISVSSNSISGTMTLAEGTVAGNYTLRITGGGLVFQLGTETLGTDRLAVGLESASTGRLGDAGGRGSLGSLASGGANSLLSNPRNAYEIAGRAVTQAATQRGQLGSIASNIFETNESALKAAFQGMLEANSAIRDGDIAAEIAGYIKNGLLSQIGLNMIKKTSISSSSVLRLLDTM